MHVPKERSTERVWQQQWEKSDDSSNGGGGDGRYDIVREMKGRSRRNSNEKFKSYALFIVIVMD